MSERVKEMISEPCIEAYVRYLGAFKVVESDYGLFDKLARPRDFEDFARVLYESVRVQERVLSRLRDGISRGEYEIVGEVEDVEKAFRIGKNCLSKVIELAKDNPRLAGSIIASLALAYDGIRSRR